MFAQIVNDMFVLGIPVLEKILRPLIIYLFLVIGLRLSGKRELASLNPFDLVVLLTLSNTVQNAIIGNDNSVTGGIIGATALLLINYLVLRFLYTNPKIDRIVEGTPELLVDKGKIILPQMKKQMITQHELEIAANKQGFISLDQIERAEIEPDGAIFFAEKEPTPDEAHHQQVMDRLDRIERQLDALRGSQRV
ncbi:MAG: DUF421 domain-containing protein [Chloroflexi bacterium]|nr:DUF421 domain-containing protein [Chloroflexota bacterium]